MASDARLAAQRAFFYTADMEVYFTPGQEAQLSQIAAYTGSLTADLVKDAALRLLEEDNRFRAAVRKGIEHEEEIDVRIERMLQP